MAVGDRDDLAQHAGIGGRLELEHDGHPRRELAEASQQPVDLGQVVEEVAVGGRVGAAHVERDVVGVPLEQLERARVVLVDVGSDRGAARIVGLDEVDAEARRQALPAQPPADHLRPVVGYPVADDDPTVLRDPKQPRARVAVRRVAGDRADLHVPEAERSRAAPAPARSCRSRRPGRAGCRSRGRSTPRAGADPRPQRRCAAARRVSPKRPVSSHVRSARLCARSGSSRNSSGRTTVSYTPRDASAGLPAPAARRGRPAGAASSGRASARWPQTARMEAAARRGRDGARRSPRFTRARVRWGQNGRFSGRYQRPPPTHPTPAPWSASARPSSSSSASANRRGARGGSARTSAARSVGRPQSPRPPQRPPPRAAPPRSRPASPGRRVSRAGRRPGPGADPPGPRSDSSRQAASAARARVREVERNEHARSRDRSEREVLPAQQPAQHVHRHGGRAVADLAAVAGEAQVAGERRSVRRA